MKPICAWMLSLAAAFAQANPNELNEKGLAAMDDKQFETAEKLYSEAIAVWRKHGPAYALHVALVQNNLAQAYCVNGEREKCAATLEEVVPVLRRTLGVRDLRTLAVLNLLGGVQTLLGNHTRATSLFEEALAVEREAFPKDVQLARSLSGLATIALQSGRAKDAEPLAEEALRVMTAAAGEDGLDAALTYANLAEVHRIEGRPERALPLFRKARAIYERTLGPDHPRVSSVLTQEAVIAMNEGKLSTAEQMLNRALTMVETSCPNCAYERAAAQNDLAMVRLRQGRFADAERLVASILAEQEHSSGVPPAEIATALNTLATVRQKERRFDDAERLKRRADTFRAYR
jgi:tetratricopeptide (TPR) repeat protein